MYVCMYVGCYIYGCGEEVKLSTSNVYTPLYMASRAFLGHSEP